jgi:D-alanyl-D-alanine carboxypeptidase/D-alanyl-D-alanine-endopeptidase (penicillin-binding protein 4)
VLDGAVRTGPVPGNARQIYVHRSRTLGEVVRATNKFSNNMMARHLLLALGSLQRERDIRVADGVAALEDWLLARGIDAPALRVDNGSGLSRDTRISARGMAGVLRAGFGSRYAPEFLASFPIAGEDHALRRREFDADGHAIVRIKTGLIDHVRAMAGYVTSRTGRTWIVVALINHPGVHRGAGTRLHDDIVRYVLDL